MKKIILSFEGTVVISAVFGVSTMLSNPKVEQSKEQLKQETKIEKVDEKIDTSDKSVKNEEKQKDNEQKPSGTEKNEKKETKSKSTDKPSSSVSNAPKQEAPAKQESNSNSSNANTSQPVQNTTQNNQQSSNAQSSSPVQKNNVSTTFYDSITGGKKEFSSESEAVARGTQIQNNELDYVLDWNEAHPDNQIQPDINYFRVYPSVIDENGKYWYYLHFFCRTGEGNDSKLKSMY